MEQLNFLDIKEEKTEFNRGSVFGMASYFFNTKKNCDNKCYYCGGPCGNHFLTKDYVKKTFTNWHEKNPIIATDDTSVDYDIFRYRQLSKEDLF